MVKDFGGMGNLMKQARRLQEELEKAQAEIAAMQVEASAGGGMVTATVTGQGQLIGLALEKEIVNPEDIDMLVDLLLAAVQEAQKKAQVLSQEKLGPLAQGMGLPTLP
jgi:nucleoid-associated protein EbfC